MKIGNVNFTTTSKCSKSTYDVMKILAKPTLNKGTFYLWSEGSNNFRLSVFRMVENEIEVNVIKGIPKHLISTFDEILSSKRKALLNLKSETPQIQEISQLVLRGCNFEE